MTEALIEDLCSAVREYQKDKDDFHLLNWIRMADALRAWRSQPERPLGGPGTYIHFNFREEPEFRR